MKFLSLIQYGFIATALLEGNFSITRALNNNENSPLLSNARQLRSNILFEEETITLLSRTRKRPNIMLIVADDLGTGDVALYWNSSTVNMPNIQRLADMGVTFKDAHSTPLCAPSRYVLLSGNYQYRGRTPAGTWGIKGEGNAFGPDQKSIAEALIGGGYSAHMNGKWHLGGKIPLTPNGTLDADYKLTHEGHDWTQALIGGPQDIGFASSYMTVAGIQNEPYSFYRDGFLTTNISDVVYWDIGDYSMPGGESIVNKVGEGSPEWDSTMYNMILVNETENFIDSHMTSHRAEDPWFIYAALGSVHIPWSPPDNYMDGMPIAGSQGNSHTDMLYEMDKVVGSLVTMVEERGLASETMFIFTSDNGGVKDSDSNSSAFGHDSHGPLRGAKGDIYEGGHRIPLIFRFDGTIPANETRTHMVGLNDIYRTLCDSLGIPVPNANVSAVDSVNFGRYLRSESNLQGLRRELMTWDYKKGKMEAESIRYGFMKFIQLYDEDGDKAGTELYNLDADLGEQINLVNETAYVRLIERMKEILDAVHDEQV